MAFEFVWRGGVLLAAGLLLAACGDGPFSDNQLAVCDPETEPMALAAADFNGDGADDMAITCGPGGASSRGGYVEVYLSDGDGNLARAAEYRVGDGPSFVTAADLNDDQVLDLVITLRGPHERGVARLLGEGDGSFGGPTVDSLGNFGIDPVAVSDADEDGAMDILSPARNLLLRNRGTSDRPGPFESQRLSDDGQRDDGYVAEVDGDGLLDAVRRLPRHGQLHVYRGGAAGRQRVVVGKSVRGVLGVFGGGDLNGDERFDLIVEFHKSATEREVRLAFSQGGEEWRLSEPFEALGAPRQIVVADFDRDGIPDLLRAPRAEPGTETYELTLYPLTADRELGEGQPIELSGFPDSVVVGDFDGNGAPDFAVRHLQTRNVTIFTNNQTAGS